MTAECGRSSCGRPVRSPAEPVALARQVDGLDLLKLDRAFLDEIAQRRVRRTGNFHAIEIDLERAAMVLLGPCRGIADAVHARRDPVGLLVKTLLDVLAGR